MNKSIKRVLPLYLLILLFVASFSFLFGKKNFVIPVIVIFVTLYTMNSDLWFAPKASFIKILMVLWSCAIVAFINSPNNVVGLVLGFILIFVVTTSSFNVLTSDSHVGYLLAYIMLMNNPVSLEQFPLRLIGLTVGVLIVLLLNRVLHRSKYPGSDDELITVLLDDLTDVIDAKLNNTEYESFIPKINNDVSTVVFENLDYKYVNDYARESVTTICKNAYYIYELINKNVLTDEELVYVKNEIVKVKNNEKIILDDIKSGPLLIALLNLEIFESEKMNMGQDVKNTYELTDLVPFIKRSLSFSSLKFSFAFKLAFLMSFWELLGLVFNLPYLKWLYFTSLVVLVPYTDYISMKSKRRIKAMMIAVVLFIVIMLLFYSDYSIFNLLNLDISESTISIGFILLLLLFAVYYYRDSVKRIVSLSLFSLLTSIQYMPFVIAVYLKISSLIFVVILANILTKYVMPYSIRKETIKSVTLYKQFNEELHDLLLNQLKQEKIIPKAGLIASSDLMNNRIEENNDYLEDLTIKEISSIENKLTVYYNFLLNNIQIGKLNKQSKQNIYDLLTRKKVILTEDMNYEEKINIYTTKYILNLKEDEERLFKQIENEKDDLQSSYKEKKIKILNKFRKK